VVNVGEAIGGHLTPAQTKADEAVNTATQVASLADLAQQHPTAQNQKNLALAVIRGAAGRVNMQEYDILTKRAGLANSVEAWANSVSTGMLPDEVFKGLIGVTKDNLKAAQAAQAQSRKPIGGTPDQGNMPPQSVIDSMKEGQYVHGPNGASFQKKGGVLVPAGAQ
jgi:hypothetical protein